MAAPTLDAAVLRRVVVGFHRGLAAHRMAIDNLNVYPVPDGDTGTNMALTMRSVMEGLEGVDDEMEPLCAAIAHGALMGARGNSGVILAQIMRGVSGVLRDAAAAGSGFGPAVVARALAAASDGAYTAVARPVEGTILTVVREASESARSAADAGGGLVEVLDAAREQGYDALGRTPQMLSVLAEAGVVDAGGAGLMLLIDSWLSELDGRPMPEAPETGTGIGAGAGAGAPPAAPSGAATPAEERSIADLRYEVMFLLDAPDSAIDGFRQAWQQVGDSIVVVGGDGIWNCHIHTDDIGAAIEAGIAAGRPHRIEVTDLLEQAADHSESFDAAHAPKPGPPDTGVGTQSPGPGQVPGPGGDGGPGQVPGPGGDGGPGQVPGPGGDGGPGQVPGPGGDGGPGQSPGPGGDGGPGGQAPGRPGPAGVGVGGQALGPAEGRAPGLPAAVDIAEPDRCGVVAVGAGAGVEAILTSMGAGRVVAGGQSMNPSTAELLAAVDSLPVGHVVVLPNNKNIVAVAEQVDAETERRVSVVPTHSVVAGIAGLLAFTPESTAEENRRAMTAAAEAVTAGEVTRAVRNARIGAHPASGPGGGSVGDSAGGPGGGPGGGSVGDSAGGPGGGPGGGSVGDSAGGPGGGPGGGSVGDSAGGPAIGSESDPASGSAGWAIRAGDWLGIGPRGIASVAPDAVAAATALLDEIVSDHHELLTVIVGEGADESATAAVESHMSEHHPDVEVEVSYGGQPLYPYYFGLE